jgi:hypothetical protein
VTPSESVVFGPRRRQSELLCATRVGIRGANASECVGAGARSGGGPGGSLVGAAVTSGVGLRAGELAFFLSNETAATKPARCWRALGPESGKLKDCRGQIVDEDVGEMQNRGTRIFGGRRVRFEGPEGGGRRARLVRRRRP